MITAMGYKSLSKKRWLVSTLAVAAGISFGFGIGYAGSLMRAVTDTPLLGRPSGDSFNQLFLGIGRLNAFEITAANCNGTTDIPSVIANETDLIQYVREAATVNNLNPPSDVAEALLDVRRAGMASKLGNVRLQSTMEARADKLLESAGWGTASSTRMQAIVLGIDADECRPATANNGSAR